MQKQMLDRHAIVSTKCGKPFSYGILQPKNAAFGEQQNGRRGCNGFCQACEVENGVDGHWYGGRLFRAVPIGSTENDFPLAKDDNYGAWHIFTLDGNANGSVESSFIGGSQARWRRSGQGSGDDRGSGSRGGYRGRRGCCCNDRCGLGKLRFFGSRFGTRRAKDKPCGEQCQWQPRFPELHGDRRAEKRLSSNEVRLDKHEVKARRSRHPSSSYRHPLHEFVPDETSTASSCSRCRRGLRA